MALAIAAACAAPATFAETVKVAFIDPLTGSFAPIGQNALNSYQMIADLAKQQKWGGSHTLQFAGFDSKGSPQEALTQLKLAIDQGYRFIVQGNGSGISLALIDAINKHNERNPGKEIMFLNHAAVDPDLTNSKCSFWHFRFDAHTDMKMEALTDYLARDKSVKKVYIIGQNYSHGQQVTRSAKEDLKQKRPDVQVVGDDLHPIAQVKDFAPYIAKIKASGADTVITGNWGADLSLLVKAAKDADLRANFYTFYANSTGVPTAMGASGVDHVKLVFNWHPNNETFAGKDITEAFKKKYNDDFYISPIYNVVQMLSQAMKNTNSSDPTKVAFALEGLKAKGINGDIEMRKADHQLEQPLYIATWSKTDGKEVKFDQENTGFGWKTNQKISTESATKPTSCQMKRPAKV